MNLHYSDGIGIRDGEWITAALDDTDTGDEPRIDIVLPGTADNRLGDAAAMRIVHSVCPQKGVNHANSRVKWRFRRLDHRDREKTGLFYYGFGIRLDEGGGMRIRKRKAQDPKKGRKNQ